MSAPSKSGAPSFSRALKRWPGWVAIGAATLALLAIGASRPDGPKSADERVLAVASRLACPVCSGEAASSSRAPAAIEIRNLIANYVDEGALTDDEIVAVVDNSYPEDLRLTPDRSGLGIFVFALPVVAAVAALWGLYAAMRTWRGAQANAGPTDVDRALVEAARSTTHRSDDATATDAAPARETGR